MCQLICTKKICACLYQYKFKAPTNHKSGFAQIKRLLELVCNKKTFKKVIPPETDASEKKKKKD